MKTTKKTLAFTFVLAALLCLLVLSASAYDGTQYRNTGIYYEIQNGEARITDADRNIVKADIPKSINGCPVTSIGDDAFAECRELTSATIPNSVKSIGDFTFFYCRSLISVTIPDSVASMGHGAFSCCDSLTSATIPNSVTNIGNHAFEWCRSLTSVTIPNSVTSIGSGAFRNCSGLERISVNSGNKFYIGKNNCLIEKKSKSLISGCKNSIIPSDGSVTNIGYSAFEGCAGLKSITIPNSVTGIGDEAFTDCTGLTSIIIPNNVTDIGGYAFCGCTRLTSITIGNSVTSIGDWAFCNCAELTSITIPNSVTSIGYGAFAGCSSLTSVTIPDSVTSIGNNTFGGCSGLTSIIIPNSMTSIGSFVFDGCTGLTSVTIPNGVTSIGEGAFLGCTGLKKVYYTGTEEQWKKISIGSYNDYLLNAAIHYNYSEPVLDSYTNEHLNFINNVNDYKAVIKSSNFAHSMTDLKSSAEYKWDKLISLDYGNYYDVVLSDLILKQTSKEKINDLTIEYAGKEYVDVTNKIYKYIKTLVGEYDNKHEFSGKIKDNEITKFVSGKVTKDSESYKTLIKFFEKYPKAQNKLCSFLTGLDKAKQLKGFIGTGMDVVNNVFQAANYVAAINSYLECDQYFKKMFEDVANEIPADKYGKMKSTLNKYIDSSKSKLGYEKEVYKICSKAGAIIVYDVFKAIYQKEMVSKLALVCSGVKIGGVSIATRLASKAGATVSQIVGGVSTGITLGVGISQLLTGASGLSEQMSMVVAVGELSPYVHQIMTRYESTLKGKKTQTYAFLFDAAFNFYKDIQLYSFDHTLEALNKKDDSFLESIAKFFNKNRGEDTKVLIQDITDLNEQIKYINCHKTDMSAVKIGLESSYAYTGKEIKPKVGIMGRKLNTDYTVTYSNNLKIGTAKVTIKGKGDYLKGSITKTFKIVPENVSDLKASRITSNSVILTWKKVLGDVRYYIYLYNPNADRLKKYTEVASTTYLNITVKKLKPATKYSYVVRACSKVGGTNYWSQAYSLVCPIKTRVSNATTPITKCTISLAKASVTYNGKAQTVAVTVKNNKTVLKAGTHYNVKFSNNTKIGKATVTLTGVAANGYTGTKTLTFNITPANVKNLKATQTTSSIKLTWSKVTGATGYRVFRYDGKKWVKVADTKKASCNVNNLKAGTAYKYAVKAYTTVNKTTYWSTTQTSITTATTPATPTLKATAGAKKATLSWNKQTGASGYFIYMATSKNGKYKKIATVKGNRNVKFTKTGLTKGKTYYFKVAAYTISGKKTISGAYSSVKSVIAK